jgi:hypothetical protein
VVHRRVDDAEPVGRIPDEGPQFVRRTKLNTFVRLRGWVGQANSSPGG